MIDETIKAHERDAKEIRVMLTQALNAQDALRAAVASGQDSVRAEIQKLTEALPVWLIYRYKRSNN